MSNAPVASAVSRRQWLVTVVLVVCSALAVLATTSGPYPHLPAPRLLFALVACGPAVLLRRWPLPVLGVAVAAGVVFIVSSVVVSLPLSVMIGLAMFFAASRLPRRVSIAAALACAGILALALGYAWLTPVARDGWAAASVGWLLPLAAAWFVGDAVAARRRYVAGLAEQEERERAARADRAVREERVRIAREMHDVVAHTLAVMTVQAGVGRRLMDRRPQEAAAALESIETIGRTAQDELRVVLGLLREEDHGSAALTPAPRLADLPELAETVRASGTPVELRVCGDGRRLSPALELSLYRVVQEALTNVVRHAPGARATVGVTVSADRVRLDVTDDGTGGAGAPAGRRAGHGIVGMRERIAAFDGWLVAAPLPGRGFRVSAEVPVREPA